MAEISVIIPTFRRDPFLSRIFGVFQRFRDDLGNTEFLIVDDSGRADAPGLFAREWDQLSVTWIGQNQLGPAAARNRAAHASRGKLLVFLDDDCLPTLNWFRAIQALSHSASDDTLFVGASLTPQPTNPFSQTTQLIYDCLTATHQPFFTSNNFALSRRGFFLSDGFDPSLRFGEDREFATRFVRNGGALRLVPDLLVSHHHQSNLSHFCAQHFHFGVTARRLKNRGCATLGGNFLAQGNFLFLCLHNIARRPISTVEKLWLSGVFLLSQGLTSIGYWLGELDNKAR